MQEALLLTWFFLLANPQRDIRHEHHGRYGLEALQLVHRQPPAALLRMQHQRVAQFSIKLLPGNILSLGQTAQADTLTGGNRAPGAISPGALLAALRCGIIHHNDLGRSQPPGHHAAQCRHQQTANHSHESASAEQTVKGIHPLHGHLRLAAAPHQG